ncbi:hypothetical protein OSCT_0691 [Oscillochloris trichoides DG-6]|uniref:Uncharacterized protein n=1 Tax=Oscillochloris trichoides DG-6 TaxID=765420 RepID=E1IBJ0_9CHLR|nr:hypothetical protein [Oscillochloris trichoides]EFO81409.1 hypothetical protein OSCT_0691 [Oscillochloris trichoides DG-6]
MKQAGQSLILVAIMLPVLVVFVLLVVEVAERRLEVAMIEDALHHATRSAVQSLDYAALAANNQALRAPADCVAVTLAEAGACAEVVEIADRFLRTNLSTVRGLAEPVDQIAARVRWTVRPNGGACSFQSGQTQSAATPLLCAEVQPLMRGIVGWGHYSPWIHAGDTLDVVRGS